MPARVSPGIFAACEARCGGSVAPSRTSSWQQQQQKTLACARRLWAAQHVQCGLFCTAPLAGASRMPGTVHHSTTYNSLCVASSSPRLPPLPPLPSPRCCWFADTRAGKGSDSCLTRSPALAERERVHTRSFLVAQSLRSRFGPIPSHSNHRHNPHTHEKLIDNSASWEIVVEPGHTQMFVALTGGLLNPPHLVFHSRRDPQKSRCDNSSELANYVYGCYSTTLLAFHLQHDGRTRERWRKRERDTLRGRRASLLVWPERVAYRASKAASLLFIGSSQLTRLSPTPWA